jgi:hypothetical protein
VNNAKSSKLSKPAENPPVQNFAVLLHAIVFCLAVVVLTGCRSLPEPGVAMSKAGFAEGPIIIQRGEHFYLRYRRALPHGRFTFGNPFLVAHKAEDAGYYYFSAPISHTEWGNLVERPLAYDEFEDFARRGNVFWLDPDGTKHPLQIRRE